MCLNVSLQVGGKDGWLMLFPSIASLPHSCLPTAAWQVRQEIILLIFILTDRQPPISLFASCPEHVLDLIEPPLSDNDPLLDGVLDSVHLSSFPLFFPFFCPLFCFLPQTDGSSNPSTWRQGKSLLVDLDVPTSCVTGDGELPWGEREVLRHLSAPSESHTSSGQAPTHRQHHNIHDHSHQVDQ